MRRSITQAVLLSAGFGTRLRSLFPDIPKVMVPLRGKPLLERHIEALKEHGVREFFVNLHYKPAVIRNHFGDGSKWGVKITYVTEEPDIRGTAGGVKNFEGLLRGSFFVIYGDVFNRLDYAKWAAAFAAKPDAPIAMSIVGVNDHPHDSDLAELDQDMRLVKVLPRPNPNPPENWRALRSNFIFHERVLAYIPAETFYDIDRQLLPDLLAHGETVYGYETSDYMKDIGTPERYKAVEDYLRKQSAK